MTLVLDVGNSRVKWGLHGPHGWVAAGATFNDDIGTLSLRDWQNLPQPTRIVGVNVAGEPIRLRLEAQLARWRVTPRWFGPSEFACGVTNRYDVPGQLGADRWAALIGARRRVLAWESVRPAAIVVNAGTAVTVDALDAHGVFLGGVVMPGLRLMLESLADKTAALDVAPGTYRYFPTNTGDALYSGAVMAMSGAVEQIRTRLKERSDKVACFVAGGAAQEIAPFLNAPLEVVDNLVLEGVLALADEA